jgi:hypothetical protein
MGATPNAVVPAIADYKLLIRLLKPTFGETLNKALRSHGQE